MKNIIGIFVALAVSLGLAVVCRNVSGAMLELITGLISVMFFAVAAAITVAGLIKHFESNER